MKFDFLLFFEKTIWIAWRNSIFINHIKIEYCITFDEWKHSGRACIYHAVGALAEAHRQQGLHQASKGFDVEDQDGLMGALVQAATPAGLHRLREPNTAVQAQIESTSFGSQHWELFEELLTRPIKLSPNRWPQHTFEQWTNELESPSTFTMRQQLKSLIYRLPGGHKLAKLWRWARGR